MSDVISAGWFWGRTAITLASSSGWNRHIPGDDDLSWFLCRAMVAAADGITGAGTLIQTTTLGVAEAFGVV